uniref:NPH3 domain-containing protein n=1 Tax=Arundo donax TaxID=35708 RepID=A0A0A9CSQ6_ARUDO
MLQHNDGSEPKLQEDDEALDVADNLITSISSTSKLAVVAKLIDGYLAQIAKDPSLPLEKFIALAESVPPASRPVHDALYGSIDMYLKEHPGMSKGEKKRLCALMDCKKLTGDASAHAVQNERLPLRVVVQVLFLEQVRQSSASAAAAVPSAARSLLLPRVDGTSCGSSRSAATTATTEDKQWAGVVGAPTTTSTSGGDASSLRWVSLVAGKRGGAGSKKKVKGGAVVPAPARRVLGKLWSGKGSSGENSGSDDTSESPAGSVNLEETKSTPSRITRHSVS